MEVMKLVSPSRMFLAAVVCSSVASTAIAQDAASANARPSFRQFRYDEDWTSLANESKRTDWLDTLKYISLGLPGWFTTVGGEIRERFELLDQPSFGAGPEDDNGYSLQRYLLASDVHLGPKLRIFTELQSGLENGRNGGPRPTDLHRLDIHQAFIDWHVFSSDRNAITIRIGRRNWDSGAAG